MTKTIKKSVVCANCGAGNKVDVLLSSNSYGYAGLDGRAAGMMRYTILYWLQECNYCGYVAESLDDKLANSESTLNGKELTRLVSVFSNNNLAIRFLKASLLFAAAGLKRTASDCALWAAWAADDKGNNVEAIVYRRRAIKAFELTIKDLNPVAPQTLRLQLILVDLSLIHI